LATQLDPANQQCKVYIPQILRQYSPYVAALALTQAGQEKAEPMRSQHFRGNVFVANLPPEFSDDRLAETFDSFGIVLSATVARDPVTGKRLRYGFVDIATERAAKLAVESMNGAAVDGHNLDVRISERPAAAAKRPPRPAQRPQHSPHRMPARASDDDGDGSFNPRPQPRRQPSFQVERRSLPRRPG
jgi:RNA recognition motif-containing protein